MRKSSYMYTCKRTELELAWTLRCGKTAVSCACYSAAVSAMGPWQTRVSQQLLYLDTVALAINSFNSADALTASATGRSKKGRYREELLVLCLSKPFHACAPTSAAHGQLLILDGR